MEVHHFTVTVGEPARQFVLLAEVQRKLMVLERIESVLNEALAGPSDCRRQLAHEAMEHGYRKDD